MMTVFFQKEFIKSSSKSQNKMHRTLLPSSNKLSSLVSLGDGWKMMTSAIDLGQWAAFQIIRHFVTNGTYQLSWVVGWFVSWAHHPADTGRISIFVNEITINCLKPSLPCRSPISLTLCKLLFWMTVSYAPKEATISCSEKLTNVWGAKRQLTAKILLKKEKVA